MRAATGVLSKMYGRKVILILSNLTKAAQFVELSFAASGNSSVVERDLAKVEVASSNLVSRSKSLKDKG